MILASHAVIGAAVSRLVPGNPYLGFLLGVASHFAADAIPHPQYKLSSFVANKDWRAVNMRLDSRFLRDLLKLTIDASAGLLLALFIFGIHGMGDWYSIVVGAIGGMFPDTLQFLYFRLKREPFVSIQKFHMMIHAGKIVNGHKNIILNALIVAAAAILSILLRS